MDTAAGLVILILPLANIARFCVADIAPVKLISPAVFTKDGSPLMLMLPKLKVLLVVTIC